ncbi:hypothetical protein GOV07_03570 [Candidatus Woesearchaeota archaeon]|nr:hypothetical protein [Candidatus Woesearchaeota archaeon]
MKRAWWFTTIFILALSALNLATGLVLQKLQLPFFVDTWGTSLGVLAAGPIAGVLVAVVTAILLAVTTSWSSLIWVLSGVLIALLTWYFWKKDWLSLETPGKVFLAGAAIGAVNAVLVIAIKIFYLGSDGTMESGLYAIFASVGNSYLALFLFTLIIEIVDKSIALFLALYVMKTLPKKL